MAMVVESLRGALAAALREVVAETRRTAQDGDWEFSPGSPAVVDWETHESPSGWGAQPLQDAYRTGALIWYLVADHALGVADLLDSGRSIALLSASRPLAESAARSWFLLATNVDASERVRRMVNERLFALHEDWRFASTAPELDSSWQRDTALRLVEVAESEYGLLVQKPDDFRPGWVGSARPATMSVLTDMLGNPEAAALFYRGSSSVSHAALHGLVKRLDLHSNDAGNHRARLRDITSAEATAEISASLSALCIAARALLLQTGWDMERYEQREADLLAIERQILS